MKRYLSVPAALALCLLSAQSVAAPQSPFDVIRSFVEKKVEALDTLKKKAAARKAPGTAAKVEAPVKASAAAPPIPAKAALKPTAKTAASVPVPDAAPRKADDDADNVPVPRVRPAFPVAAAALIAPDAVLAPKKGSAKTLPPVAAPVIEASLPPAETEGKEEAPREGTGGLAALGVTSVPLPPISKGACVQATPIAVSAFGNGTIKLTAKATTNPAMAKAMAGWLHDDVVPAAADLGGRLTGLEIAASYDCRNRDGLPDAKLSEHAFADAIDISGFQISGKGWIEVGGSHPADAQKFLDRIRKAACGPFTTVLGPGSDSYHANHFHLDLAKRRTAGPSKGLFCQ